MPAEPIPEEVETAVLPRRIGCSAHIAGTALRRVGDPLAVVFAFTGHHHCRWMAHDAHTAIPTIQLLLSDQLPIHLCPSLSFDHDYSICSNL